METKYKVAVIVSGVITVIGLVTSIINIFSGNMIGSKIIALISYGLVGWYVFRGYKKPHGNFLKYTFMIFDCTLIIDIFVASNCHDSMATTFLAMAMIFISYVAGRLNRIEENIILIGLIFVLLVIANISTSVHSAAFFLKYLRPSILWLDLSVAYLARYELHKKAGLQ